MLRVGRDRLTDRGLVRGLDYVQLNAEALPFPDASFDLVTIAFGLRNVTDKQAALNEMQRVLKVGGRAWSRPGCKAPGASPIRWWAASCCGCSAPRWTSPAATWRRWRSEEHTSELQSLMRISYAVFCL